MERSTSEGHLETANSSIHMKLINDSICDEKAPTLEAEQLRRSESANVVSGYGSLEGCIPDQLVSSAKMNSNHHNGESSQSISLARDIQFTETAPPDGHLMDDDDANKAGNAPNGENSDKFWQISLQTFTSKRRGKQSQDKLLPRRVRSYYKKQDELIQAFEDTVDMGEDHPGGDKVDKHRMANLLAKATLFVNLALLLVKVVASVLSGSLVVISSVVDSCVDLMSGIVIWWTTRAVKKHNRYVYPEGRTRLEPIAIVIISVIMSVASIQLVAQSVQSIVHMAGLPGNEGAPTMDALPIAFVCVTVVTKVVLVVLCKIFSSPLTDALAQDHRNDILSNTVALFCGLIAYHFWKFCDPIGAIVISGYIFISWWLTGAKQIRMLTGYTANPQLLKKLTWICLNHHKDIRYIDTVRAFHFGINFIVEVDIVLPEDMTLKEAHDIGEPLQQKLEKLPYVERAFVHLDYEFQHNPNTEHKVV